MELNALRFSGTVEERLDRLIRALAEREEEERAAAAAVPAPGTVDTLAAEGAVSARSLVLRDAAGRPAVLLPGSGITDKPLPVSLGGTGAVTGEEALAALFATVPRLTSVEMEAAGRVDPISGGYMRWGRLVYVRCAFTPAGYSFPVHGVTAILKGFPPPVTFAAIPVSKPVTSGTFAHIGFTINTNGKGYLLTYGAAPGKAAYRASGFYIAA